MAKPKALKVRDSFHLRDLVWAGKLSDGDRVCLLVPKHPHRKGKRKYGFVRGYLYFQYRTYCECCGPELFAWVHRTKDDTGPKKFQWR